MKEKFSSVPAEEVATFWDQRPCNIKHSAKSFGSKEYFEEVEKRKYFVEPHIPRFAEFERWNGKKVLEIGCGIGTDTINFARHGAEVTAVDLSEKSIILAEKRAKLYGVSEKIKFHVGNAEELKKFLPQDSYDLIYSFGIIHHTPNPSKVLQQLYAYLHDNGQLKIMVYHRYSWKALWILFIYGKGKFWRWDKLIPEYSEAQTGCPITYTFSKSQICAVLKQQGFRVKDIFVDHIFPYRIDEYLRYRYVKVWYFRWMPKPLFRLLEKHFGWHLCVTAQLA